MAEPRPRLVAIDPAAPAPAAPQQATARPSSRRSTPVLALLLLAAAIGLGYQSWRVRGLEGQLTALGGELAGVRSSLTAYQGRMQEVREAVASLRELVARDPLTPASEPTREDAP